MKNKQIFFKAIVIALLSTLSLDYNQLKAQVKLTSANHFQIGYSSYTPMYFGSYPSGGVNNGRWSVEYWDNAISTGVGGLNFWIPWPAPNYQNNVLFLKDDGTVGIGTTTITSGYKLEVNGKIRAVSLYSTSDERLKENIKPLQSSLEKLNKLNGVSYQKHLIENKLSLEGITDETKIKTIQGEIDRQAEERKKVFTEYGFLAQEVQKLFPELVEGDDQGMLGINYLGLIPVAIEAIKEQQVKIEAMQAQLNSCCANTAAIGNESKGVTGLNNQNKSNIAQLQQNIPNPFTQNTQISFFVSEQVSKAMLNIYDMQGTELKSYPITVKGNQSITIQGSDLKAGMYLYTLIADGKEIDTKRMILTK